MMYRLLFVILLVVGLAFLEGHVLAASAATSPSTSPLVETKETFSFLRILQAGGTIGGVIILLSVASLAISIELFITVRSGIINPPGLANEVTQKLRGGQWSEAVKQCRESPSVLGSALYAGLNDCEMGWESVEKSTEDAIGEQTARLYRKVEYLNVIGNIAPMLGLLGTVVGMVLAFRELAHAEGYQRAGDLAEGIYLALITTVEGLIVAIPSLGVYAYFNQRIAHLISETTYIADQVLRPVKKMLLSKKQ